MSAKDKRIVFVKKGVVDFEEFELGEPQENEVLVAVKAQLLNAGTELAYLAGITKAIEDGECVADAYCNLAIWEFEAGCYFVVFGLVQLAGGAGSRQVSGETDRIHRSG